MLKIQNGACHIAYLLIFFSREFPYPGDMRDREVHDNMG